MLSDSLQLSQFETARDIPLHLDYIFYYMKQLRGLAFVLFVLSISVSLLLGSEAAFAIKGSPLRHGFIPIFPSVPHLEEKVYWVDIRLFSFSKIPHLKLSNGSLYEGAGVRQGAGGYYFGTKLSQRVQLGVETSSQIVGVFDLLQWKDSRLAIGVQVGTPFIAGAAILIGKRFFGKNTWSIDGSFSTQMNTQYRHWGKEFSLEESSNEVIVLEGNGSVLGGVSFSLDIKNFGRWHIYGSSGMEKNLFSHVKRELFPSDYQYESSQIWGYGLGVSF